MHVPLVSSYPKLQAVQLLAEPAHETHNELHAVHWFNVFAYLLDRHVVLQSLSSKYFSDASPWQLVQ